MPAVSTSTKVVPSRSRSVSIESRVVPGISETIVRSWPTRALTSDDFPTFGRPTIATVPTSSSGSGSVAALMGGPLAHERGEGAWGNREVPPQETRRRGLGGETWFPPRERAEGERRSCRGCRVPGPALRMELHKPVEQAPELPLDLGGGLPVSARAAREAVEAHRVAPGDRDGVEVAGPPVLRPVDRTADDGDIVLERDHPRARLDLPGDAGSLARPLHEEAERVPVADDLPHQAHGLAVGLAASHSEGPERADQLTQPRDAVRLGLR